MSLDLVNELFHNLKENKFVQNFIQELSNYLKNHLGNINNSNIPKSDFEWNNLLSDDLTLYNSKITTKFRDKMLLNRRNILEEYALSTKEKGEMFYIFGNNFMTFAWATIC